MVSWLYFHGIDGSETPVSWQRSCAPATFAYGGNLIFGLYIVILLVSGKAGSSRQFSYIYCFLFKKTCMAAYSPYFILLKLALSTLSGYIEVVGSLNNILLIEFFHLTFIELHTFSNACNHE
jgi:hypothetical protein